MVKKTSNNNLQMKLLQESLKKQNVMETYIKAQFKATKNLRVLEKEKQETIRAKKEHFESRG
jgi:hypothetical protein